MGLSRSQSDAPASRRAFVFRAPHFTLAELFGFFGGSAAAVSLAPCGHLAVVFGSVPSGGHLPAFAPHNRGGRNGLIE